MQENVYEIVVWQMSAISFTPYFDERLQMSLLFVGTFTI